MNKQFFYFFPDTILKNKDIFIYNSVHACICVSLSISVRVQDPIQARGIICPRNGVTVSYEPSSKGTGNQTSRSPKGLCKSLPEESSPLEEQKTLLITKSFL